MMINRRFLRIKAFQALYAFYQSDNTSDASALERDMIKQINRVEDLYLLLLLALVELTEIAHKNIEIAKEKLLPTQEDLNPNMKYADSAIIQRIAKNKAFLSAVNNRKLSWANEIDDLKKIQRSIRESVDYITFMENKNTSFNDEKEFWIELFKNYLSENELIVHHLEEKSIYWSDDLGMAAMGVVKTLQSIQPEHDEFSNVLLPMFKDEESEEQDMDFVKRLLRTTIRSDKEYSEIIATKAKNWDVDRIAIVDVILMKMAMCEFEHFATVPVKVSLNEYIELSKYYSTPKSKQFINGVLDKTVAEFKAANRIKKIGRGLIE